MWKLESVLFGPKKKKKTSLSFKKNLISKTNFFKVIFCYTFNIKATKDYIFCFAFNK